MSQTKYITKEGLEKLQKELEARQTSRRKEIKNRIEEAIKLGDLSENAEYHEAKDDQGLNEARIRELEDLIKNAEIIDNSNVQKTNIDVGSKIKVEFNNQQIEYTIVGASEADPAQGLISNESPLGQAFIGKKANEIVEVEAPAGIIKYKILSIE